MKSRVYPRTIRLVATAAPQRTSSPRRRHAPVSAMHLDGWGRQDRRTTSARATVSHGLKATSTDFPGNPAIEDTSGTGGFASPSRDGFALVSAYKTSIHLIANTPVKFTTQSCFSRTRSAIPRSLSLADSETAAHAALDIIRSKARAR